MKKYFKIAVLTFLAVGLMSGSAFAAASLNGGNATVAAEAIAAATDFPLPITAANTAYQPGGAVAATSQLKFTLAGGKFSTTVATFNLCDWAATTVKRAAAASTPPAGGASVTITLTEPLASGTVYTLQPDNCVASNTPLGAAVLINQGSTDGSTVVMSVDNALSAGDGNITASATIATVTNQFTAALLSAATDTIDFSAVPTMTLFKGATPTLSRATFVIKSNETIQAKVATGHAGSNTTCAAWPVSADFLTLTVTPAATTMGSGFASTLAYQATPYVAGAAGAAQTIKTTIASTDTSAAGDLTMSALVSTCGASAASTLLATGQVANDLKVGGTTALTARSYKLAIATKAGAALKAAARTLLAATTAWTWSLDATQYYLPLIKTTTGVETYIKLQSKSALTGANGVSIQVLATDGTMVTVTPSPAAITSGVPTTISGADIAALVTAAGKAVDGVKGFAAIITINTPNADVFGYANVVNSAGEKRVPLQRVTTVAAGAAWSTIAE